ncbi:hypothetical protein AB0K51_33685 [Kitasatospora sp. NPDC049285]|uniref:hypothetical protein n=1 Tax=Kitasatospora sp. NPDC049285 TaxID=3157096 RepID=UPI003435C322
MQAITAVPEPARADDNVSIDTSPPYRIQDVNSGQCALTRGYAEGAPVFQYVGMGLVNAYSGKCPVIQTTAGDVR